MGIPRSVIAISVAVAFVVNLYGDVLRIEESGICVGIFFLLHLLASGATIRLRTDLVRCSGKCRLSMRRHYRIQRDLQNLCLGHDFGSSSDIDPEELRQLDRAPARLSQVGT